jgi:hypothetical protein
VSRSHETRIRALEAMLNIARRRVIIRGGLSEPLEPAKPAPPPGSDLQHQAKAFSKRPQTTVDTTETPASKRSTGS